MRPRYRWSYRYGKHSVCFSVTQLHFIIMDSVNEPTPTPEIKPLKAKRSRRDFVKAASTIAIGAGLIGSGAVLERTVESIERRRAAKKLDIVIPRVSMDRYIRSTVGLRPHRDIGFKLEKEKLGNKVLVHNWGHGGSGWSLSWGTSELAIRMAEEGGG